jgi:hypothetical protein
MTVNLDEAILAARALAGSPQWEILRRYLVARFGFTERTTLVADSFAQTAFNEGQRALALHLVGLADRLTVQEQKERNNE